MECALPSPRCSSGFGARCTRQQEEPHPRHIRAARNCNDEELSAAGHRHHRGGVLPTSTPCCCPRRARRPRRAKTLTPPPSARSATWQSDGKQQKQHHGSHRCLTLTPTMRTCDQNRVFKHHQTRPNLQQLSTWRASPVLCADGSASAAAQCCA
jgi:hypothetical protein